jgi:hypothetical protein
VETAFEFAKSLTQIRISRAARGSFAKKQAFLPKD